jgi:hypothetical protein
MHAQAGSRHRRPPGSAELPEKIITERLTTVFDQAALLVGQPPRFPSALVGRQNAQIEKWESADW